MTTGNWRKWTSPRKSLIALGFMAGFCAMGTAQGQTFSDAFAGFGANNDEPINIEATDLKVQDKSNSAIFSGNVVATQGDASLKTAKLVVHYDGSATGGVQQSISMIEATGGVHIASKDQTATGDKASFDMKKQIMVMTGKEVVLSQGPNVLVGDYLTVDLKTGEADMKAPSNGRVKVLIQPKSLKNAPAAQ